MRFNQAELRQLTADAEYAESRARQARHNATLARVAYERADLRRAELRHPTQPNQHIPRAYIIHADAECRVLRERLQLLTKEAERTRALAQQAWADVHTIRNTIADALVGV